MKAFPCKLTEWNPDAESWIDNGEQQIKVKGKWQDNQYGGMDLRDYFAAKAMQGMLTNQPLRVDIMLNGESLAQSSYQIADAMMKAREE